MVRPIKTKADYERAAKRLEYLCDNNTGKGGAVGDEIKVLSILVRNWEDENVNIDIPDVVEYLKYKIDQGSLTIPKLIKILGNKSTVSKVLNKKRYLTLEMIQKLHKSLDISPDVLIKHYKLVK